MVVNIKEIPVIVGNHHVKKVNVHILVLTCVLERKDGVNMINIWMGTRELIALVVVVSEILFYLDIMETNMIIVIVLLSLLVCGIIGVVIYLIVEFSKKNKNPHPRPHPSPRPHPRPHPDPHPPKKCLKGCYYSSDSGNCGEAPCKKDECPFSCAKLHIGEKGWCQYDKYKDGNPELDCTGCGCRRN
jgi:hypothetical protein